MREYCLKIIDHYGINHQQRKLAEEVFELNEAIIQYEVAYGDMCYTEKAMEGQRQHIAEELADVMVLLRQFQAYYNIEAEQLGTIMYNKIQRTLKRMEKE